jgi:hypothetical protein
MAGLIAGCASTPARSKTAAIPPGTTPPETTEIKARAFYEKSLAVRHFSAIN